MNPRLVEWITALVSLVGLLIAVFWLPVVGIPLSLLGALMGLYVARCA